MPERRGEIGFILTFVILFTALPPLLVDFYPFSIMPMYSDNSVRMSRFEVFDAQAKALAPNIYGLHDLYLVNPHPLIGSQAPQTLNANSNNPYLPLQELLSPEILSSWLRKQDSDGHSDITIVQTVIGQVTIDQRSTIGEILKRTFHYSFNDHSIYVEQ